MINNRLIQSEIIIDGLLNWALANRNTPHEFVSCYTYNNGEIPQVIADAKAFLGESIKHLMVVKDD